MEKQFEQLKIIQQSIKTTVERIDKIEKINNNQVSQFAELFPPSHM
jgi:hypothetical protein